MQEPKSLLPFITLGNFLLFLQITDGSCGVGAIGRNRIIQALPLPVSYPVKIHILPVVSPHDPCLQQGWFYILMITYNTMLVVVCLYVQSWPGTVPPLSQFLAQSSTAVFQFDR